MGLFDKIKKGVISKAEAKSVNHVKNKLSDVDKESKLGKSSLRPLLKLMK